MSMWLVRRTDRGRRDGVVASGSAMPVALEAASFMCLFVTARPVLLVDVPDDVARGHALHGEVGHARGWRAAVPVPLVGTHDDDVAGADGAALVLGGHDPLPLGDVQHLSGEVHVRLRAAAGLEMDGEHRGCVTEGTVEALELGLALEVRLVLVGQLALGTIDALELHGVRYPLRVAGSDDSTTWMQRVRTSPTSSSVSVWSRELNRSR